MRAMRFPRRSYARRADKLAVDLWNWHATCRERAFGPDADLIDFKTRETAEGRAYYLEHVARLADELADAILAVR